MTGDNEPIQSFLCMGKPKKLRKRSEEQEQSRCLEYFRRVDFSKVDTALEKARELSTDPWMTTDSIYRIFHHSFKMYSRFHNATYLYLTYMLEPLYHHMSFVHKTKECDEENVAFDQIIYELDYWYMDPLLINFVKQIKNVRFTLERNDKELWFQDARDLVSSYFMIQNVCLSTLEALQRMGKKEGFLWADKPATLDQHDALFLEAWEGIGTILRYGSWQNENASMEKEIKKILLEKLK